MWLGVCLGRDGAYGDGDQGRDEPGADFLHMTSKDKKSPRAVAAGLNKEPVPFRGAPGEVIEREGGDFPDRLKKAMTQLSSAR